MASISMRTDLKGPATVNAAMLSTAARCLQARNVVIGFLAANPRRERTSLLPKVGAGTGILALEG